MFAKHLNICHWNIRGMNEENERALLDLTKKNDIVCLSETHCGQEDDISFENFQCFKLCRKKSKNNRYFGGIAILFRTELKEGIKILPHKNDDFVWIKLCKSFFGLNDDYYLCYAYIPPENSKYYQNRKQDTWEYIENDIFKYSKLGYVFLCGDLNARSGNSKDFIEQDESPLNENDVYYELDENMPRNSQDKCVCTRGKRLLEACISAKLRIVNGRKLGDSVGQFTSHNTNGSSMIDYVISHESMLMNIPFFKVDKFMGDLSDHCSLSWAINIYRRNYQKNNIEYKYYKKIPQKLKWDNKFINKFQNLIKTEEISPSLQVFLTTGLKVRSEIDSFSDELRNILIKTASKCFKYKKILQGKPSKKWFDESLRDLKKYLIRTAKQLQKDPFNSLIRTDYFKSLSHYNKARKQKARAYKAKLMNELNETRTENPSFYWKLLSRIKENYTDDKASKISILEWESYFKKLNISSIKGDHLSNKLKEMESKNYFNQSDFSIKDIEIRKCIINLKNNKAPGLDGILNEMIKYSQFQFLPIYTKLFNEILRSGFYPKSWRETYITPIFKKGNPLDTNNYRGISITSNIGKLFNMVMQNRLTKFFKDNNLIDEKQIGFNKGSRTSDHIMVVKSLIDKYTKKGKKLYTCFVDFRKAFDSINHTKLFYKLRLTDMGTLTYNIIKDMYMSDENNIQVKIGNLLSNKFRSNIGVKQGDSLSPILFNFYVNEITKYLDIDADTPTVGNKAINFLLYADDLVLFSTSKAGLQKSLDRLQNFSHDWDLQINTDKTKIMIFGNYRKIPTDEFLYLNKPLQITESYRYLGLILQRKGKFNDCQKDLYNRGMKAMFKLIKSFRSENPDFNTCMHLFDHLIKPIMTYGSEIWGPLLLNDKNINFDKIIENHIEKCHQKFIRFAIGVNKRAPLFSLYGESGRYPLPLETFTTSIKYHNRLIEMEEDSILGQCFLDTKIQTGSWMKNFENIIKLHPHINQTPIRTSILKKQITSMFKDWWQNKLFDDSRALYGNKLRNYRIYKNTFRREEYLDIIKNKSHRGYLAKLRLSCHKLHIETGRFEKQEKRLHPKDRICNNCSLRVCEDEEHFINTCSLYTEERAIFLEEIRNIYPHTAEYSPHIMYIWLMSNVDEIVILKFSKFVHLCFMKRPSN